MRFLDSLLGRKKNEAQFEGDDPLLVKAMPDLARADKPDKAFLIHHDVIVPLTARRLDLGTGQ